MITESDDPDYRYPRVGERLWHEPWQRWVTVTGQPPYGPIVDEVGVKFDDGCEGSVKLRSLREPPITSDQDRFQVVE